MAVIVQRMVDSVSSGIMFTKDPVTGDDKVVIEAAFGLAEAITSGMVSPDRYICDGRNCKLEHHQINRKEKAFHLSSAEATALPEDLQTKPTLGPGQAEELARTVLRLEGHFGSPQDIEWAMDGGSVYELGKLVVFSLHPVTPDHP